MRARDFARALGALADAMSIEQMRSSERIREVMPAFQRNESVADIVALAQEFEPQSGIGATLGELASDLNAYNEFFERACKPSFRDDAKALVRVWRHLGPMSIREFIATLQDAFKPAGGPYAKPGESLVEAYVRRLNETKHDPTHFPAVVAALENTKDLKKADVVEIASRFAFRMAKSTSRADALARIKRQHESSELAGAKDKATRGTSAA